MSPEADAPPSLRRFTWVVCSTAALVLAGVLVWMLTADFRRTSSVTEHLEHWAGPGVQVDCPPIVLWRIGHTYECDLITDDKAMGHLIVTMRDDDGRVSWVRD